jgi:serine/threonine protein kinase
MKGLESPYVVKHIDSWIEENSVEFKARLSSNISFSHRIRDPENTVLLHIQMEFCCQTLNEVIKQLSNKMKENDSQNMKNLCYFISCELLTEITECVHYLHERNVIHRDLKPENILITEGINRRFVTLTDFGLSVNHEFKDQSHTQFFGNIKIYGTRSYENQKIRYEIRYL